jgi:hypothetical protein
MSGSCMLMASTASTGQAVTSSPGLKRQQRQGSASAQCGHRWPDSGPKTLTRPSGLQTLD